MKGTVKTVTLKLLTWIITGLFLIFCRPVNNPLTGVDRDPGARWPGKKEAERLRNKEQGRRAQ